MFCNFRVPQRHRINQDIEEQATISARFLVSNDKNVTEFYSGWAERADIRIFNSQLCKTVIYRYQDVFVSHHAQAGLFPDHRMKVDGFKVDSV